MGILDRFSLDGKIALVTAGAGPLFGSSIATALAEAGATVVTASRSRERNESFAELLRGLGHQAHGLAFDLEDADSIHALHRQVLEKFGRCDVLVNSAIARQGHVGQLEEQTPEIWRHCAAGDLVGLFLICQRFVAHMAERGSGSIINIASIYGVVANDPGLYEGTGMVQPPTYNFVKAGMINYTRYLAAYYGKRGVRANAISPGGYFNDQPAPFVERYCQRVPIGRMMDEADLGGAAVFLASDAAAYVTGCNLLVDGGWTCI